MAKLREQEKKTLIAMIRIYCQGKHKNDSTLCDDCRQLQEYSLMRLAACRFGEEKTVCRKCKIHCYQPKMREKIREVMRYSGPRMLIYHPALAVSHIIHAFRK